MLVARGGACGYHARSCSTASPTGSGAPSATSASRGTLDEEAISRAMREIRLALLEADVNLKVVRDFVARVRERALGEEVLKSLTPGQQVVKVVHEELTELIGSGTSGSRCGVARGDPARRPPGLGQDDHRRQARAAPAHRGPQARPDRRRPPAPGRDRPARAARQADRRARLPHRHAGSGRGDARGPRARARGRHRRGHRRHRRPPPDRRGADGGARARPRRGEADERRCSCSTR